MSTKILLPMNPIFDLLPQGLELACRRDEGNEAALLLYNLSSTCDSREADVVGFLLAALVEGSRPEEIHGWTQIHDAAGVCGMVRLELDDQFHMPDALNYLATIVALVNARQTGVSNLPAEHFLATLQVGKSETAGKRIAVPSMDSELLALQAIACFHRAPQSCQCRDRRRSLALIIDARVAKAREEARRG